MFSWVISIFGRLGSFLRLTTAAQGAGLTLGTLVTWVVKYAPLIVALIKFIEERKGEEAQKSAATDLERALHVLNQTQDPTMLTEVLRAHCDRDGCMLP